MIDSRSPSPRCALVAGRCVSWQAAIQRRHSSSGVRPAKPVTIEVLDVGQGDSILIRSPEGKTALIDAGPTRYAAVRALKRKGITSLDMVAISHHHSDHYGGMDEVVKAMKPRYFVASRSGHSTSLYLKLLKTVRGAGDDGRAAVDEAAQDRAGIGRADAFSAAAGRP